MFALLMGRAPGSAQDMGQWHRAWLQQGNLQPQRIWVLWTALKAPPLLLTLQTWVAPHAHSSLQDTSISRHRAAAELLVGKGHSTLTNTN